MAAIGVLGLMSLGYAAPSYAREAADLALKSKPVWQPSGVFGSLEIRTNKVSGSSQWASVLLKSRNEREIYQNCSQSPDHCSPKVRAWRASFAEFQRLDGIDLLNAVNSTINNLVQYRDDIDTFGYLDYWASPLETLTGNGFGDCEDYVILKYTTLIELGFSDDQLRIVVLKDTRRNLGHAVLSVRLGENIYILDNLARVAYLHTRKPNYKPVYSVNRSGSWMNLVVRKRRSISTTKFASLKNTQKQQVENLRPTIISYSNQSAKPQNGGALTQNSWKLPIFRGLRHQVVF